MYKAPAAALDWLALKGRTAHWLKWNGGEAGRHGCRVADAEGWAVVGVRQSSHAVGSGTWGSRDGTPGMKA